MDSRRWARLEELFHHALELEPATRANWLAEACGEDTSLAAEVALMLAAHESPAGLAIEATLLPPDKPAGSAGDPAIGMRVGAWRLVELLGHGGMGEVWLAERSDGAYQQRAAVKLVRFGWHRRERQVRFERERQVLARLLHPHIATLLDGGVTETGDPYLVMEYIEGVPITQWCDDRRLSIPDRIRLFLHVCDAVQFAHANLVVHRDLKPANILVGTDGRPILLDFGIAKLLDAPETADATRPEERILTPEYAAPEQLRGEHVTVATDVWGLGVLLHELLTGTRPFHATSRDWREAARQVEATDVRRPSSRFALRSGAQDGSPDAADRAQRRGAAPRELERALKGDLDAILAHALQQQPERRYFGAAALADDLRRSLQGMPVLARPDSRRYRLSRFVRRHRLGVAAASVLALALLLFGVVATWQAQRIERERARAVAQEAQATRVLGVLVDLFATSDPRVHPGGDTLSVADLLRLAEGRVDSLGDQPLAQARLWETVASIHGARSEFPDQQRSLRLALEAASRANAEEIVIRVRHEQALLATRLEGAKVGLPRLRASLAEIEARYPEHDERVARAIDDLASASPQSPERSELRRRSLAIRRALYPDGSVELAGSLNSSAADLLSRGRVAESRATYDEALAVLLRHVPTNHPDVLLARFNRCESITLAGQFELANQELREVLELRRRVIGPRSTPVAATLFALGLNLMNLGRPGEAADSLAIAHATLSALMGAEHHAPIGVERHLVVALALAGRTAESDRHRRHVEAFANHPGSPPSREQESMRLALASIRATRTGRADLPAIRQSVERIRASRPGGSRALADGLLLLGTAARISPDPTHADEARSAFAEAATVADTLYGSRHPIRACARMGEWLSLRRPLNPAEQDSLDHALRQCGEWGLAPGALLKLARAPR